MKVYLIEKSSGSYDDYYSHIDTGFFDKSKAEEYILKYNTNLDLERKQGSKCSECSCGKYQYLSQVIRNCNLGVKLANISDVETLEKHMWFECDKMVDSYYAEEEHYARIIEIEVQ